MKLSVRSPRRQRPRDHSLGWKIPESSQHATLRSPVHIETLEVPEVTPQRKWEGGVNRLLVEDSQFYTVA